MNATTTLRRYVIVYNPEKSTWIDNGDVIFDQYLVIMPYDHFRLALKTGACREDEWYKSKIYSTHAAATKALIKLSNSDYDAACLIKKITKGF